MLEPTGMTFEELRDKGYAYDTFEYRKYEKGLLHPDKKPGFIQALLAWPPVKGFDNSIVCRFPRPNKIPLYTIEICPLV